MSFITNKSLETLLQYSTLKNKVISENIANVGNKEYTRKDVEFKNVFDSAMNGNLRTTNSKHVGTTSNSDLRSNFEVVSEDEKEKSSEANSVDIDKEMAALAENTLRYKFATKKLGHYYKNLQNVIKGD